jgi:DNA-binding transcriptional MerR regulator
VYELKYNHSEEDNKMLKIGDFSRLSRVSVRMLRYYDDAGLIKPEKIDKYTGYRYYSEAQLPTMWKINTLKDMGFGVAAIGEIMKCGDNPQEMERLLILHRAELEEEAKIIESRLKLLDTTIERMKKGDKMKYNCVVKELPKRYVASVRQIIPRYDSEGMLWHILFSETSAQKMKPIGLSSAILHDKEYKENDVDVEVQIEVEGTYHDTENVKFKNEPAQMVASITFKGAYDQFSQVYAQLASWVDSNGYCINGPMIDIYHVSPHETQNPMEFVTEVCCPVIKK